MVHQQLGPTASVSVDGGVPDCHAAPMEMANNSRLVHHGSASNQLRISAVTDTNGSGRRRLRFFVSFMRDVCRPSPQYHAVGSPAWSATRALPDTAQGMIDRRSAHRQKAVTHIAGQPKVAVALHHLYQNGNERSQPLSTDPI
jgi:hypothetical protein